MIRTAGAVLALAWACAGAQAQDAPAQSPDGVALLKKMAGAARQLNYQGVFVYRHGNQVETSRIWHLVEGGNEYERLETLDGPPREVVRTNDEVTCFYPQTRTIKVEQRAGRRFPAVVTGQLNAVTANYSVRRGEIDRVAGNDCQVLTLEPRDRLRYGHSFCVDVSSGLPLRAKTLNERSEVVEMFAFTQISIGGSIPRDAVRSRFSVNEPGWRVERAVAAAPGERDAGWDASAQPPGFRKVLEVRRTIQGRNAAQVVFSDGLAAVSVFIEAAGAGARPASELAQQGAIHIFSRALGEHVVTALGEAPAVTVRQFANSMTFRGR